MLDAIRTAAAALVAVALACALPANADDGTNGYLVISIAEHESTNFSSYAFFYRKLDGTDRGRVRVSNNDLFNPFSDSFRDEDRLGFVEIEELAPGDYELFSFDVISGGYPGERHYGPTKAFSIPFTVHPGEAVYLGEFMGVSRAHSSIIGIKVHRDPYFVVSDQEARDIAKARRSESGIQTVRNAVPRVEDIASPDFTSALLPEAAE